MIGGTRDEVEAWMDKPECINDYDERCRGTIEYRMSLSGTGKPIPRCDLHWRERLDLQDEINSRYGGDLAPHDFDPAYAGERWEDA